MRGAGREKCSSCANELDANGNTLGPASLPSLADRQEIRDSMTGGIVLWLPWKRMMKKAFVSLALVALSSGSVSAKDARSIVGDVSTTIAAANLKTIQYSGTQSYRPGGPYPKFYAKYSRIGTGPVRNPSNLRIRHAAEGSNHSTEKLGAWL